MTGLRGLCCSVRSQLSRNDPKPRLIATDARRRDNSAAEQMRTGGVDLNESG